MKLAMLVKIFVITEPFLAEGIMHLGKANAKMYLLHPWKSYISHVGQDYEGGADEFRLKLYASMLLRWVLNLSMSQMSIKG